MIRYLLSSIIMFCCILSPAQARLILNNGGIVRIDSSAYLVIDNPSPNAITRNTSGHIISEGPLNRVKWNIGTAAGNYIVPFGIGAAEYIPVSFSTAGASGAAGSLTFAVYPVGSWLNSSALPTVVTNFINNYSLDNSAFAVDRFWRIEPTGFTAKPALTNLNFTYRDPEWSVANNAILESNLIAQRYNSTTNEWDDYIPGTVTNTTANTSTVAVLPSAELYTWWTLVDNRYVLPIELSSFSASCNESYVQIKWQTASESNNDYFEVERSADGVRFYVIGQVYAAGNSDIPQDYSLQDNQPLTGKTYYRLKQTDKDGNFSYSSIIVIDCKTTVLTEPVISIYPNPATDVLILDIKGIKGKKKLTIYSVLGQAITNWALLGEQEDIQENITVSALANATYLLRIDVDGEVYQVLKFVKK
jgi:hypothetical protein